jgi:hypothetical protein
LDPSTELASATSHVPTAVPAQILYDGIRWGW